MSESKALALSEYDRKKYNVLLPSTEVAQVSQWHVMRVSLVEISTDTRAGDIYKAAGGGDDDDGNKQAGPDTMYALAKPALMRIANAAGIIWDTNDCKLVSVSRDYACYKAVGTMRGPDGTPRRATAIKEIDLTVVEAEIRKRKEKTARQKNWSKEFTEQAIQSELLQWRKNKAMRAETGAHLRVIKQLLAMRSAFTMAELQKPFVVPRFDINYNDPDVRRMFIKQQAVAQAAMFGGVPVGNPFAGEDVIDVAPAGELDEEELPVTPEPHDGAQAGTPSDELPELPPDVCRGCGSPDQPEAVVNYSTKHFGKTLCRECQKGAKRLG